MIDGEALRDARARAGLTQEQLAAAVGVTMRSVGNWERGEGVPRNKEARVRALLAGHLDSSGAGDPLAAVSDLALISELARRLGARDQRERGGDDRDAAPSTRAGESPATVTRLRPDEMPLAARRYDGPGKRLDAAYDTLGEESQDTEGDGYG